MSTPEDNTTTTDNGKYDLLLQQAVTLTAAALSGGHMPYDRTEVFLSSITTHLGKLAGIQTPNIGEEQPVATRAEKPVPSVPVRKSVTPDFIICLEDGKKLKMLKRHLMTHYQMTPEEYRSKWDLPSDYPMVAPNYAASRRDLAKKIGLGNRNAASAPQAAPAPAATTESEPAAETAEAPKTRGRKKALVTEPA